MTDNPRHPRHPREPSRCRSRRRGEHNIAPHPSPDSPQVWAKRLSKPAGSVAIVLLNRGQEQAQITAEFSRVLAACDG